MNEPLHRYTAELAGQIETAWQDRWEAEGTFQAPNPAGPWAEPDKAQGREKLLVLDMFPYPSGSGLHVGHPLGYIATDVFSRYNRMLGKNVLHAMGYDAFGLPAEQYAIETGTHPRVTTEANIVTYKRQLRRLGLDHDDRRSIKTIDPGYYKWTQWIFTQIFNAWYDPEAVRADGGLGKARPISELVDELANGSRELVGDFAGRQWSELSNKEQGDYLDGFRLTYADEAPVNWAPGLGTVLANEEVTNEGRSERGNFPVFKANLRQWKMRITVYADRLAEDLDRVEWPENIKALQRNWIGKSHGARVHFTGPNGEDLEVFTTRPDTLFGASFMVLAPEHPLVASLVGEGTSWPEGTRDAWTGGAATPKQAVEDYQREAGRKSDVERQMDDKTKTGVFTGTWATNPVNGAKVPVFIADYVLMGYGTGAIMAVPSGDDRDFEFAQAFDIDIIDVISPVDGDGKAQAGWEGTVADGKAFTGEGVLVNSANDSLDLNGMSVTESKQAMIAWLEQQGTGTGAVNYRMRDWLFSRQRYWGEPFPVVYDADGVPHALPESMLPLELPEVDDYSPRTFAPDDRDSRPEAPLARATEWVNVTLDLGDGPQQYRRETNTMPQWAGSCWYYLRYLDPANDQAFVDPAVEQYWMGKHDQAAAGAVSGSKDPGGVDLYVGGAEHAVLHLLYARFWHKVLFDLGHVSSEEPFRKYFAQGMIQAYAYTDGREVYVPAAEIEERGEGKDTTYWYDPNGDGGEQVTRRAGKMGKSLKNAVSPDEMYEAYGADTLRVYEMSMGPLDLSRPWETRAVVGSQRFLQRLWRNIVDEQTGEVVVVDQPLDPQTEKAMHKTIDAVRKDYATLGFNTGIARLIEFNNALTKLDAVPREAAEALVLMTAPVAPHIAEELWKRLGHGETIAYAPFPVADQSKLVDDQVTCVLQIKGKVRATLEVSAGITEDELKALALAHPKVVAATENGVRTVIVRAPKLVNVVPA
ncbi:leucine--tRNA ligase [Luteococcus japonicus]|uniref:Leucine--tRNA ligase n=1 Tax=Luteococcus japonicus LSP_Lj1 TaxID=1255658 RepID=A0A1R4IEH3_9ACTN|nr:leucine--tRNA ligase [Luteococcus japonicus]SJN18255.1 Leucyl-tRNA synthetase [Luteococcus japonicus LSP_Lj1]